MQGLNPADVFILGIIILIIGGVILFADVVIFAYWFSYKYKEYTFEKAYGPIVKFPPRSEQEAQLQSAKDEELEAASEVGDAAVSSPLIGDLEPESQTDEIEVAASSGAVLDEDSEYNTAPDPNLMFAQGGIRLPFASSWSLVHPFVGIQIVVLGLGTLVSLPLFPLILRDGVNAATTGFGLVITIIGLILQNAGFVGVTAYFLKGYGASLASIGLRKPTSRELAIGLGLGICLTAAAALAEKGLSASIAHLAPKELMDRLTTLNNGVTAGGMFDNIKSRPMQVLFAIAGAVAAPIGEEVFFRGLLYNSLKKRWGVGLAVLLSAICFAVIHLGPLSVLVIIPMGVLLALAYEKTGSLWVPILMHAVNNGAQFAIAMASTVPHK